jgi:predicted metal-dependent HD superfamily phosphohydrolase
MADNQEKILQDAQDLVTDLLNSKLSKSIRFHTLQHTQEVVAACQTLADYHQLPVSERLPLMIAAWFHDTGYTGGEAKDHETMSIHLVNEFMTAHELPEDFKNKVIGCINATRMPQSPENLLEKIICDADLFHLGTDEFKEKNRLLREEIQLFGGKEISKDDWRKINIRFLDGHKYFTKYGKDKLEPIKDEHLLRLRQKDKNPSDMKPEKKEKDKAKDKAALEEKKAADAKAKAKADKEKQSERGIATVFRIMAQNQNNLSGMADSKANILISVNAIILSIMISSFATTLEKNENLKIPLVVLMIVCVSAIILSILATRPNVTHGTFTEDDIRQKKTNLLFFGNFYKMGLKDYDWAIQEMLADKDYLYSSITKDNYFLGVVLARKYRYLRYAYNVFMYGLILSILAFGIAIMIPEYTEVYTPGG